MGIDVNLRTQLAWATAKEAKQGISQVLSFLTILPAEPLRLATHSCCGGLKLDMSQQYALASWKTNSIQSCSKRDVTVPTYSALPRPQVEYCIQAWDPKLKKDVRVQRRAIEIIRRTLLQRQTGAGLAQPEECFRETSVWCSST